MLPRQGAPWHVPPGELGCWSRMQEDEEAWKGCRRRRQGGAHGVPRRSRSRMLARMCWRGQTWGGRGMGNPTQDLGLCDAGGSVGLRQVSCPVAEWSGEGSTHFLTNAFICYQVQVYGTAARRLQGHALCPCSVLDAADGLDLVGVGLAAVFAVLLELAVLSVPLQHVLVTPVSWVLVCHPPAGTPLAQSPNPCFPSSFLVGPIVRMAQISKGRSPLYFGVSYPAPIWAGNVPQHPFCASATPRQWNSRSSVHFDGCHLLVAPAHGLQ